MELYLVQHGEAMEESADPNRPLTPKGREVVSATAAFLKGQNVKIDEVWHSQKLRARQTADIITETLGIRESIEKKFLNPNDPVSPVADVIAMHPRNILIAGHLPFLAKLAAFLVSGSEKKEVVAFQPGKVASLRKGEAGWTLSKEESNLA